MSASLRHTMTDVVATWSGSAWRWWVGELCTMVPSWLQHAFGVRERPTTRLILSRAGAAFSTARDPGRITPLQMAGADERNSNQQHALADTAARVELAPDLALITSLTLPETAARSLRQIVSHQLEKLVPLDPSSVAFDCRIDGRSEAAKTLTVAVAIVKRCSISDALQIGTQLGVTVQDIVVPTPDAPELLPFIVWTANQSSSSSGRWRWLRRGMVVIGCACLLLAYGLHGSRLQSIKEELQIELAATRRVAEGANAVTEEARRLSGALQLLQARRTEATPLRIIADLTQSVPSDSWVNQLSLRGRSVEIMGYSPRAADLIARLEQSQLLANPRFRSAITMASDGRGERFHLSLELRQGALP